MKNSLEQKQQYVFSSWLQIRIQEYESNSDDTKSSYSIKKFPLPLIAINFGFFKCWISLKCFAGGTNQRRVQG